MIKVCHETLKSRGIWIRENTQLLEQYSKYFNVHVVATLKKRKKHLTEMKDVKGCDFIMPEAVCFKVTEANSIKMLFYWHMKTRSRGTEREEQTYLTDRLGCSDPSGKEAVLCL